MLKKNKKKRNINFIISIMLNIIPLSIGCFHVILAQNLNAFVLTASLVAFAIIMLALSISFKFKFSSGQWLIFIGLFIALYETKPLLITILILQTIFIVIDDLIFEPNYTHYQLLCEDEK